MNSNVQLKKKSAMRKIESLFFSFPFGGNLKDGK